MSEATGEIRRVSVCGEDKVEIGFVFVSEATSWRPKPGFDTLEGERLAQFLTNHGCNSIRELEELAPERKGSVGVDVQDPVGITVSSNLEGPDDWAIDVANYIRPEDDGED